MRLFSLQGKSFNINDELVIDFITIICSLVIFINLNSILS